MQVIELDDTAPVVAVRQFGQLMTSRGPMWAEGTHAVQRQEALKASGLRLINTDAPDDRTFKRAGYRRLMTPTSVAELDLKQLPVARVAAMKRKWRSAWRGAQTVDIAEQRFDRIKHAWILKADLDQQRIKRFRGLPHTLLHAYATCQPKAVRVFIASDADIPIAAMVFVLHKPVVTYHIGWTDPPGRARAAHHQMIVQAADIFAQRGYHRLDLGHVDTVNSPGLARFKIGCGAQVRALGGTWVRLQGR